MIKHCLATEPHWSLAGFSNDHFETDTASYGPGNASVEFFKENREPVSSATIAN